MNRSQTNLTLNRLQQTQSQAIRPQMIIPNANANPYGFINVNGMNQYGSNFLQPNQQFIRPQSPMIPANYVSNNPIIYNQQQQQPLYRPQHTKSASASGM